MTDFHVGDRVVCLVRVGSRGVERAHGTVVVIDSGLCGVAFDVSINGHNLACEEYENGVCESGFGWWVYPSQLVLEGNEQTDEATISVDEEAFNYGS